MKFFFDNCLSPHLARILAAYAAIDDDEVCHLRDRFPANTKDIEWMQKLGSEGGWTVISGDTRILRSPHERRAWHQAKLTGFFLAPAWLSFKLNDQSWRLLRRWPAIRAQANLVEPGAAFSVGITSDKFKQLPIKL